MNRVFFIVGPTATGKSELAADVALKVDGEIVNADAFQIYSGFDILSAKPNAATQAKVRHHLVGSVSPAEEMNAAKFRSLASAVINEIESRGKLPIVVGGSGLYLKALTHGLSETPAADAQLRNELNQLGLDELRQRLEQLDPKAAEEIDLKNKRRVVRALEIGLLTGRPVSEQREKWKQEITPQRSGGFPAAEATVNRRSGDRRSLSQELAPSSRGVFVFRDRDDLYARINRRVEEMFKDGVIQEVAKAERVGATASKMIGFREIKENLQGNLPINRCVSAIQQATRRYAKRQLTWFRRQPNFESLNLSLLTYNEAVEWMVACARRAEG